jgi:DNA modification methylase
MAYLTPGGQAVQIWDRQVNTFWKPVLLFGAPGGWIGDVVVSRVNDNAKERHPWEQSESGMLELVGKLTQPGDLVCDPFLGAGTTGAACLALGRRFVGCDQDEACVRRARARLLARAAVAS